MRSLLPCLSSALLAGLLLTAPQAEARFGKSSDSSSGSSSKSSSSSSKGEKKDSGPHTHEVTPVGHAASPVLPSSPQHAATPPSLPSQTGHVASPPEPPPHGFVRSEGAYGYGVEPALPPPVYVEADPYTPAPLETGDYASRRSKNFLFGFDMQLFPQGTGLGVHLGLEGERLGAMVRASGLSLNAEDGSGEKDELSLVDMHLSWAVLKGRSGRVRLEGGMSVAKAPGATFMGPSLGLSAEYYLTDSLALEGRVQGVPVPCHQVDAAGGAVVYFAGNLVALRGGLRVLVLNDAGLVDGVVHEDVLPGPYLSLGLAI